MPYWPFKTPFHSPLALTGFLAQTQHFCYEPQISRS
jgi:hypothetical protein